MKAAHFLLTEHLWNSPPNDALMRAYNELGVEIDYYAPNSDLENLKPVKYGLKWLLKNMISLRWAKYDVFSCTSEDPIVIAAILSVLWRKPLVFISDEIKSGSYVGNRKRYWKRLCRWGMRRAELTIVNDDSRIKLQREYANLTSDHRISVYPGCFLHPPKAQDQSELREKWNIPNKKLVVGFSGGCNLSAGIDWALESLDQISDMHLLAQPLSMNDLSLYLIKNHRNAEQIYFEKNRLSWQESWSSMGGIDIGVAIYRNLAPQFQNMGVSSNRLCMFLAMGVPVIVSRQPSFQFIEDYNCGLMVSNAEEFSIAVATISQNLEQMKQNALVCTKEYINTSAKYGVLKESIKEVLKVESG